MAKQGKGRVALSVNLLIAGHRFSGKVPDHTFQNGKTGKRGYFQVDVGSRTLRGKIELYTVANASDWGGRPAFNTGWLKPE